VTARRTRWSIAALLTADFCSAAASMAQATILGKLVYDLTGSELDLGLLGLAEFAPAALLVLLSGTVADRIDRRRIVAASAVVQAVMAIGLGWYAGTSPTSILPIFALVVGFGIALAFSAPAGRALPADLVEAERLPWLIARSSVAFEAGIIIGPVVGAFLYVIDVRLPFAVIAGLLVVMAGAISLVHTDPRTRGAGSIPLDPTQPDPTQLDPTQPAPSPAEPRDLVLAQARLEAAEEPASGYAAAAPTREGWHQALEGLRFVRQEPVLLGAISLDLFAVLFGGAIALLPAIAKNNLGVGVIGLGWLRAAAGIGAGLMTLVLAFRPVTRKVGRTLLLVVGLFGVFTILLGVTRNFVVAFAAIVVLSGADAVSVFIRATLVPLMTPAAKRGRVGAVENVFIGASNELGAFESGVLGQLLGTTGSVVLGGVATLGVALGWCWLFPQLRRVDRFPVPPDDPDATRADVA
jgi:predicted MFS family arabinose efflux permease